MRAINIADIYGRYYLINFDLVKFIEVSDKDKNGDLGITFTDQSIQWIAVGRDRLGAVDALAYLFELLDAQGWIPQLPESGGNTHE